MTFDELPFEDYESMPHHHDAGKAEATSARNAAKGSGKRARLAIELLRERGPLTDYQLTEAMSEALGVEVSKTGTGALRHNLMRDGWVVPTGVLVPGPFGPKYPNELFAAIPEGQKPVPVPRGHKQPTS